MGGPVEFGIEVETLGDCRIVRVTGDLDLASADALEDALAVLGPVPHVVVDLGECTFLDSSGTRAIGSAVQNAERVSVVATDPGILRVLEITAMDTKVTVHPTVAAAI